MKTTKYSRQREAILANLRNRYDHPTADMIYTDLRKDFPTISLGTVYRNLSKFVADGTIIKVECGDSVDHFDGNPQPHYHFICNECHSVIDLQFPFANEFNTSANQDFDGIITGHSAYFYGCCGNCKGTFRSSLCSRNRNRCGRNYLNCKSG